MKLRTLAKWYLIGKLWKSIGKRYVRWKVFQRGVKASNRVSKRIAG